MAFFILDLLGFPRIILKILGFKNLDSSEVRCYFYMSDYSVATIKSHE